MISLDIRRALFERALAEELGVVVSTNNPDRLKLILNADRKSWPEFAEIMICLPSRPEEIFLIRRTVELDQTELPT